MGPLNEAMKADQLRQLEARLGSKEAVAEMLGVPYGEGQELAIPWTTLSEYLEYLVEKGIAPNVASFIGATTVRIHELGCFTSRK